MIKRLFLNNLGLFVCTREKVINNFKSRLFPIKDLDKSSSPFQPRRKQHLKQHKIKATKAKTKCKISSLKLHEEFLNKTKIELKKYKWTNI